MEDVCRIKVNGEYQGYIKNGTHAIAYILSLGMEDLKYYSFDGIVNWINGALDTAEEMITWKKDAPLQRRVNIYRNSLERIQSREQAENLFTNILLSCEGLSTLSGFGMANIDSNQGKMKYKSKIWVNPEKISYR